MFPEDQRIHISNLVPSSRNGNENLRESDFIQFLEDDKGEKISEFFFLGFNSLKQRKKFLEKWLQRFSDL